MRLTTLWRVTMTCDVGLVARQLPAAGRLPGLLYRAVPGAAGHYCRRPCGTGNRAATGRSTTGDSERTPHGAAGRQVVDTILTTTEPQGGTLAALTGVLTLVLGATAVFGELEAALNLIWEVQPKPLSGVGSALGTGSNSASSPWPSCWRSPFCCWCRSSSVPPWPARLPISVAWTTPTAAGPRARARPLAPGIHGAVRAALQIRPGCPAPLA